MRFLKQFIYTLLSNKNTPVYVCNSSIHNEIIGATVIQYLKEIGWEADYNYKKSVEGEI